MPAVIISLADIHAVCQSLLDKSVNDRFIFILKRHNIFACFDVRHVKFFCQFFETLRTGKTVFCFERTGLVVETRMNDRRIACAGLKTCVGILFEYTDPNSFFCCLKGRGAPDGSCAYHYQIILFHVYILIYFC